MKNQGESQTRVIGVRKKPLREREERERYGVTTELTKGGEGSEVGKERSVS